MMHVSMKFHEILKEKCIFDIWPLKVTLILEVVIYKWYATHRLVMMHTPMKFREILFNRLEVVVRTNE